MIENMISYYLFITQTSYNGAVDALLQLNSYPSMFLSRFYILHINIHNLHLIQIRNCQNKQTYMFRM